VIRRAAALLLFAAASSAYAAVGVPGWVPASVPSGTPVAADTKAVVLLDDILIKVESSSLITTRHRRVVKVLTAAGRDYAYAAVPFDRDTKILGLRGWGIAPGGMPYAVTERDAVEVSPYSGELYSDARVKLLRIPGADPGSIVAWEYEQRDRPYMLQAIWQFQDELPVALSRFQILLPQGWTYDARWSHHAPVEHVPGGWELRDIPAIADEPRMPAPSSLAGRLAVTFGPSPEPRAQSWSDIASWFADLASPRLAAAPGLQSKVRELTTARAPRDSVRALARFAQRDVRYVAIEIGIGGYQPHFASEVFANRYGDCKDKATLLRAMLKEIGVESHYVIVHTTRGVVDPEMPTIYAFNHVILAIRMPSDSAEPFKATLVHPKAGKLLLFDPTSTTTPFGELPPYLQASRGLLVLEGGGELIALPAHAPDTNQLRRKATLQLTPDGTLKGNVEEVRTGWMASEMRQLLQSMTASERTRYIESVLSAHLAHYTVAGVAIENLDDPESDLVTKYTIAATSYAVRAGDMTLVRPRVLGQKPETIVDVAERKQGYVTEGPSLQTDDIEIAVAPTLKLDELPEPVTVSTPAVQYSSQSEFKDGVLRYRRNYTLNTFFVAREALPELNKAFARILADERASAIFK